MKLTAHELASSGNYEITFRTILGLSHLMLFLYCNNNKVHDEAVLHWSQKQSSTDHSSCSSREAFAGERYISRMSCQTASRFAMKLTCDRVTASYYLCNSVTTWSSGRFHRASRMASTIYHLECPRQNHAADLTSDETRSWPGMKCRLRTDVIAAFRSRKICNTSETWHFLTISASRQSTCRYPRKKEMQKMSDAHTKD